MIVNFKEQIQEIIKILPDNSIRFFAWLCAVRALPFLGADGNFDYWKETKSGDKRQNYLLAILRALDGTVVEDVVDTDNVRFNARVAARVDSAARAADVAAFAVDYGKTADIAAEVAAEIANKYKIPFDSLLIQDLNLIKTGTHNFQNDTAIYGNIWHNFQMALHDLDCAYWGNWYDRLFKQGFILDDNVQIEIRMRLAVPGEIIEQGAATVARYVTNLNNDVMRLNEARIIILGDKGSGKTSLARRLINPASPMPGENDSTEGVDVTDWRVLGDSEKFDHNVNVHIWDFAGHVITHAAHRCFMSNRCLYILLINGRIEGENSVVYWLEQICNYGGNSPVLVLINVQDNHRVEIPENYLKQSFPSIMGFYYVNISKDSIKLEEFRQIVMMFIRDNPLWRLYK